jgi:hypothetical protein
MQPPTAPAVTDGPSTNSMAMTRKITATHVLLDALKNPMPASKLDISIQRSVSLRGYSTESASFDW